MEREVVGNILDMAGRLEIYIIDCLFARLARLQPCRNSTISGTSGNYCSGDTSHVDPILRLSTSVQDML